MNVHVVLENCVAKYCPKHNNCQSQSHSSCAFPNIQLALICKRPEVNLAGGQHVQAHVQNGAGQPTCKPMFPLV